MEILIKAQGVIYQTKCFNFPGGELQVSIPDVPGQIDGDVAVLARLQSAEDVTRLLLVSEILERIQSVRRRFLTIPYLPFARQDRVMQPGEAFSLKVMARLINGMGYDRVTICDPHSDVAAALIERIQVVSQLDLVRAHEGIRRIIHSNVTVVAPDAGAVKKAFGVAQAYRLPLVAASKIRDVKTGAITRTDVGDASQVAGRNVLIVDDICDGGRTFIDLAKLLKEHGAERIFLYVTHGIFSRGFEVFEGLLDGILTTDSFMSKATPLESVPLSIHYLTF